MVQGILAGYTIANSSVEGTPQGFLTVALTIICFICKKVLLSFTDPIGLDTAMLIAGAPPFPPPHLPPLVVAVPK